MKKIVSLLVICIMVAFCVQVTSFAQSEPSISYRVHVSGVGWQSTVTSTSTSVQKAGIVGEAKQMERMEITLADDTGKSMIQYRAYVEKDGWQEWKSSGEMAGTTGEMAIEAIQIKLDAPYSQQYDVMYRVYSFQKAWSDWTKNGDTAGLTDIGSPVEAIEIKVVNKNSAAVPEPRSQLQKPSLSYETHVQDIGWMDPVSEALTAGTTGQGKRMEAIAITLEDDTGKSVIQYRTHVANIGWQDWKSSGKMAGTKGKALAIEAIQIKLDPTYAQKYDVLYRTHVSKRGWLGWTKNGATSGSTGMSLPVEAIQIKIVDKDSIDVSNSISELKKPGLSYKTHVQNIGWMNQVSEGCTSGTTGRGLRMESIILNLKDFDGKNGILYNAHVSNIGWQGWKSSGQMAGTTGRSLAVEAIQIKLSSSLTPYYDIYYRLHCSDIGWLGWAKNGETAGTTGCALSAQAIEIKLVKAGEAVDRGGSATQKVISNATMSSIASRIGTQSQRRYAASNSMCTAYSISYCRAYLYNDYRQPTAYWTSGGAAWSSGGGTKRIYNTNSQVLSATKSQIDRGRPCIIRVNSSAGGHCVVAFKYVGKGTSTSNFTIIDPWNGSIRSLSGYSIHSSNKYVVTF